MTVSNAPPDAKIRLDRLHSQARFIGEQLKEGKELSLLDGFAHRAVLLKEKRHIEEEILKEKKLIEEKLQENKRLQQEKLQENKQARLEAKNLRTEQRRLERRLASEVRGRPVGTGLGYTSQLLVMTCPDMHEKMKEAARAEGVSKSEWVRRAIQKALTDTEP